MNLSVTATYVLPISYPDNAVQRSCLADQCSYRRLAVSVRLDIRACDQNAVHARLLGAIVQRPDGLLWSGDFTNPAHSLTGVPGNVLADCPQGRDRTRRVRLLGGLEHSLQSH